MKYAVVKNMLLSKHPNKNEKHETDKYVIVYDYKDEQLSKHVWEDYSLHGPGGFDLSFIDYVLDGRNDILDILKPNYGSALTRAQLVIQKVKFKP